MTKTPNVTKIISFLSTKDGKIRFEGDSTEYKLAQTVLDKVDFTKFFIKKGSTVEVGINEGYINFLKKVKGAKKEEAPKQETTPTLPPTKDQNIYTLQAVAASKAVVKFKDYKPEEWIKVSEELQSKDFQALGLVAKAQVAVITEDDVIKAMTAITGKEEVTKPETQQPKYNKSSYTSDNEARQTSIESQAAVNAACQIVARTAPDGAPASKINEYVKAIAEANYQLIQDLKKK